MPGLKFRVLLDSDKNEEVFRDIIISNEADFETKASYSFTNG